MYMSHANSYFRKINANSFILVTFTDIDAISKVFT